MGRWDTCTKPPQRPSPPPPHFHLPQLQPGVNPSSMFWVDQESLSFVISCPELLGAARSRSELLRAARNRLELLGAARACSELLGAARSCSELLGTARSCSGSRSTCEAIKHIIRPLLPGRAGRRQLMHFCRRCWDTGGSPQLPFEWVVFGECYVY